MNNWREVFSWQEPESLVGWLVCLQQGDDRQYMVVTGLHLQDRVIFGTIALSENSAINEYENNRKGYRYLVESFLLEDYQVIPIRKIF